MTVVIKEPTLVTVYLSSIGVDGLYLKARDINDQVVGDGLTFDELFARDDLWVYDFAHPSRVPLLETFSGLHRLVAQHQALKTEQSSLISEAVMSTDRERVLFLQSKSGPINLADAKIKTLHFMILVAMKAITGLWPYQLSQQGLV